jgi:hypothetical protein
MLLANLQGFKIGVKVEMPKDKEHAFPAQSLRDPADDDDETDDMSRSETHWKRFPPKGDGRDKPTTADQGGSNQQQPPPANQQHQQASDAPPPQDQAQPKSLYTYSKGYYKVSAGKLRPKHKQSVGSSSAPLPSAMDSSVSKPASAPAKTRVQPIPFNQYGSSIPHSEAFADASAINKDANADSGARGSPILLSEDDSPPAQPNVDKIQKMTPEERAEVGWESPPGWDFDNETIAARFAKLKKKRDGEVENPAVLPEQATSEASTLVSGSRRSSRILGSDAEPVLQKAIRATAVKNASGMTPSEAFVSFPAFSDAHFLEVVSDSSLVFDSAFGSPRQVISLVRAKEIAQALLAEAIVKTSVPQQVAADPVEVPVPVPSVSVQPTDASEHNLPDSTLLA